MGAMLRQVRELSDMIKFEHTVFALPFAFLGALAAAQGFPPWQKLLWIVVAMAGARTAAMTFNRLVDADIDSRNPRTRMRQLPAGTLSKGFAWAFLVGSCLVFVLASAALGPLCMKFSPVAL